MPTPSATRAPKRTLTTMRLPSDLMRQLSKLAEKEGRSRSNMVEKILRDAVAKKVKAGGADVLA